MIELPFWFGGVAETLIASYATFEDADAAFNDVISELCFLYGGNSDSIAPLIKEVKNGKSVGEALNVMRCQWECQSVRWEVSGRVIQKERKSVGESFKRRGS